MLENTEINSFKFCWNLLKISRLHLLVQDTTSRIQTWEDPNHQRKDASQNLIAHLKPKATNSNDVIHRIS